jgi:hypothetical protein
MIRRFAQIVALVTVMAAAVNAQCALSCALLNAQTESRVQDHSCCRHHKAPAHSCPALNEHSADARLDAQRVSIPVLIAIAPMERTVGVPATEAILHSPRRVPPPDPVRFFSIDILRV